MRGYFVNSISMSTHRLHRYGPLIIFTCVAVVSGSVLNNPRIYADEPGEVTAGTLIIKYKEDTSFLEKREFRNDNDLEQEVLKRDVLKKIDVETVQLEEPLTKDELKEAIRELERNDIVEYAEPNYEMNIQAVEVNDTKYLDIPNYKQYISLDAAPDPNGTLGHRGSVRVPEPFQDTDLHAWW